LIFTVIYRYIASKVYYFGVGGGIEDFTKIIQQNNDKYNLVYSVAKTFDDGKSNIRQIIRLSRPN